MNEIPLINSNPTPYEKGPTNSQKKIECHFFFLTRNLHRWTVFYVDSIYSQEKSSQPKTFMEVMVPQVSYIYAMSDFFIFLFCGAGDLPRASLYYWATAQPKHSQIYILLSTRPRFQCSIFLRTIAYRFGDCLDIFLSNIGHSEVL